ncbi:hypothetical protein GmHk_13G036269 [Glycine max]|nr:hypothetical protein GmHk_13G036269 [Glycine max]
MEIGLGYNSTNGKIISTNDEWKKLREVDPTTFGANQHPYTKSASMRDGDDNEGDDVDQEEPRSQPKISSHMKKRKSRENFQMTFANALIVMSETSKRKVIGSSSNAIAGEVVGPNNEDYNKLITCLNILEKLEGISDTPFTKVVKALKDDSTLVGEMRFWQ